MVAFEGSAGNRIRARRIADPRADDGIIKRQTGLKACTDFLSRHPFVAFVTMGAAFILFGFTSVNLYVLLAANVRLFLDYGLMVIEDGALRQLAELLGLLALSVLFWLLFVICERSLVRRLLDGWSRSRTE